MTEPLLVQLDEHGAVTLDGIWELWPGDAMDGPAQAIRVPALWEAEGWLELDGCAWYRRRFVLDDASGWWTLRFGAVMDLTDVWLNGVHLGGHDNPFTPFAVDPTGALRRGENELCVRVIDPAVDDPEHVQLVHGKQGWAGAVFPSPPSLYLTYGGIWQPVVLRRHGPVVVDDVFVNSDPDDLRIEVGLRNVSGASVVVQLGVRAVGRVHDEVLELAAGATVRTVVVLGATDAARWSPGRPMVHDAVVDAAVGGEVSDSRRQRFGLRTIGVDGTRLLLNGEPYRMKSALVQGFRADTLYAEGSRAAIEEEVRAALAMGLNTLRLHIKAFDPTYLDVCDELGMLLHCDIPVAEPIAHDQLGADGTSVVATRAVQAVHQQIERDRNHPSVIMWSLMNELGIERFEARAGEGYEQFARALAAAARAADPTRPIIENDWIEPDPARVFDADVLTAHWYGRLHADYLARIERRSQRWAGVDRPLLVSEFGDWGLPVMAPSPDAPFWDPAAIYAESATAAGWPGSLEQLALGTQRYQGLSDRLQAEVFRRHDHLAGYCLTELTDVPHELNGVLDLHRRPKPAAAAELTRANQPVLPMLELDSFVAVAGTTITAPLHVANDGPSLDDVVIEARIGGTQLEPGVVRVAHLDGHRAEPVGSVTVTAPMTPGSHDLVLTIRAAARAETDAGAGTGTGADAGPGTGVGVRGAVAVAENRYPIHVVAEPAVATGVQVRGDEDGALARVLTSLGATVADAGPLVVAEGSLTTMVAGEVRTHLASGGTVVVLAQAEDAAPHYPVAVTLQAVATAWGSSVFQFTTDSGALPSLPRRTVLVTEEVTIQAGAVVTSIAGASLPDTPVVIAFKPVPGAMTGTVVGSTAVGPGRLVVCQYRLTAPAAAGDAAARAVLADLLRWAAVERPVLDVEEAAISGGRRAGRYAHVRRVAR